MRRGLWILLCCWPLLACAKKDLDVSLPTSVLTLKNGLTVVVREDHRAPVELTSIWYKVGGSYEHDGITGISHVLEHMMFKGTKAVGPGQFSALISQYGGRQNAVTTQDYTQYYEMLPADRLELGIKLEADRMQNLQLDKSPFQKEKQVVLSEQRMRVADSPRGLTWQRLQATAFVNNPYHHPVIGWVTDIKHLTLDDVKAWYQTWYVPNNAVLVVVGDVQPKAVFTLAKAYFGPLKSHSIPTLKPRTEVASKGKKTVTVHVPAKVGWVVLGYHVPSLKTASESWQAYALTVLAEVLSAGDSSRLPRDLVRKQQVAVSASASYSIDALHGDLLTLSAMPAEEHSLQELQVALLAEVHKLQTTLVDEKELERVKAQVIAENIYYKDSIVFQSILIGRPMMSGLSWKTSDAFVRHIKAVTPQQIQAVARKFLINNNLTVAQLVPKIIDNHKNGADQDGVNHE